MIVEIGYEKGKKIRNNVLIVNKLNWFIMNIFCYIFWWEILIFFLISYIFMCYGDFVIEVYVVFRFYVLFFGF